MAHATKKKQTKTTINFRRTASLRAVCSLSHSVRDLLIFLIYFCFPIYIFPSVPSTPSIYYLVQKSGLPLDPKFALRPTCHPRSPRQHRISRCEHVAAQFIVLSNWYNNNSINSKGKRNQ